MNEIILLAEAHSIRESFESISRVFGTYQSELEDI